MLYVTHSYQSVSIQCVECYASIFCSLHLNRILSDVSFTLRVRVFSIWFFSCCYCEISNVIEFSYTTWCERDIFQRQFNLVVETIGSVPSSIWYARILWFGRLTPKFNNKTQRNWTITCVIFALLNFVDSAIGRSKLLIYN